MAGGDQPESEPTVLHQGAADGADEFAGTGRFAVRRRLGSGGMGVVYEAWDREQGAAVALKTLRSTDAAAIYRLKREFRSLADVAHPNLVTLHQLFSEGGRWFFSMELVEGVDFLSWVRPGHGRGREGSPAPTRRLPPGGAAAAGPPAADCEGPPAPAAGAIDPVRLRAALGQLAGAIGALHQAGRLHRDLKPSNVLVTPEGRVVVLDFGLATGLDDGEGSLSSRAIAGTPLYMAPEQAAMEPVGPAADWYAVGVMLYEALTGRPPFQGTQLKILMDKQHEAPVAAARLAPGAPPDLCALCDRLLRRDPDERPAERELLGLPGAGPVKGGWPPPSTGGPEPLVGQAQALEALRQAFAEVRQGRAATVLLHGGAGVGTSAVARAFAEEVEREADAVVLSGRCYEQESVPFKALDSLVDALCRWLVRRPRLEAEALLPRDARALARMFPVLNRVEAVAGAPRRGADAPDLQEVRSRAGAALRELLGRIADRHPLVLVIDGLQWGDPDSATLLADLLRAPDAPSMLLVACQRTVEDDPPSDPAPTAFPEPRGQAGSLRATLAPVVPLRVVEVQPLPEAEASELARRLLQQAGLPEEQAARVARESRGNPFFAHEMVRALQVRGGPRSLAAGVTLEETIALRLEGLPGPALRILEAAAVASAPTPPAVLARAAELDGDVRALFSLLRAAHLLRIGADERVEPYHDRIGEAVRARIEPERRVSIHRRIAIALESAPGPQDAAALAGHFRAAGMPERAADYAVQAATRAAEALAFHRAARYYRMARALRTPDGQWGADLEVRLADALANAGLGAEAARAYLSASQRPWATRAGAIELRRCGAEQYLRSGHIDEGLGVLRDVLASHGLGIPTSPRRALLSLLGLRARVWLRGTRFTPRDPSQVAGEQLARVDVCWAAAVGLGMVDITRGASFQAQHLLLALEAAEPVRVARALAAEAPFVAVPGGRRAQRQALRLVEQSRELGQKLQSRYAIALASFTGAVVDFLGGRWRRAHQQADEASALFREHCTGVAWEVANSQLFSLWSLFYLGELGELRKRVGALLREARARGDLYAATSYRTGLTNVAFLVDDDVAGARREVAEVLGQWSQQGFHFQHYWSLLAQGLTDLYAGDGPAAHARMEQQWPRLRASLLLRTENVAIEATHLKARAALAALDGSGADPARRAAADRDVRWLLRVGAPWATALGQLLKAGLAQHAGAAARARTCFEEAALSLERLDMTLFAAAARRRAGRLRGGSEGEAAVAAADAVFARQGVLNPERMTALLAPGR